MLLFIKCVIVATISVALLMVFLHFCSFLDKIFDTKIVLTIHHNEYLELAISIVWFVFTIFFAVLIL